MGSHKPNRIAVRWGLDSTAQFLAVPHACYEAIWKSGATPYEERVLTCLLVYWRWVDGPVGGVSAALVARRIGTSDRAAVKKALASLDRRGLIVLTHRGNGHTPTVDLRPLVTQTRVMALGGAGLAGDGVRGLQVGGAGLAGNLLVADPQTCEVVGSGMEPPEARGRKGKGADGPDDALLRQQQAAHIARSAKAALRARQEAAAAAGGGA